MARIREEYEMECCFSAYEMNDDEMELNFFDDTPYERVEVVENIPTDEEIDALLYANQDPKLVKEYKRAVARSEKLFVDMKIDGDVAFLWNFVN